MGPPPNPSDRSPAIIETLLAVAQVAALLVPIVVVYASFRIVGLLARQVRAQAEAVARAVELGLAQRRDAVRPVLAVAVRPIEERGEPTTTGFRLAITNAGAGPAFAVVATLIGLPALAESEAPAAVGASRDLVMAGRTLMLDFAAPEPSRRGARHAGPRDAQPAGEVLLAFRDSLNADRTTRARLGTTRWIEERGAYGLRVTSQVFGE